MNNDKLRAIQQFFWFFILTLILCMTTANVYAGLDPISWTLVTGLPPQTSVNQTYPVHYTFTSHLPFKMPTPLTITLTSANQAAISSDTCSGKQLMPNETCDFEFSFQPTLKGKYEFVTTMVYGNNVIHLPRQITSTTQTVFSVNHIIVIMQENHSFDNYFGVLPYVNGGPYHTALNNNKCDASDHRCVDGLTCNKTSGGLICNNVNFQPAPTSTCNLPILGTVPVFAFHNTNYCVRPDLWHEWSYAHQEVNLLDPNDTLHGTLNGYAVINQQCSPANVNRYETMGYYNENDIAYYYSLAQTFAMSDQFFSSAIGPTLTNRLYLYAGTSFGHISTDDLTPLPTRVFEPLTGSLFELLNQQGITWKDYSDENPWAGLFIQPMTPEHFGAIGRPNIDIPGSFYNDAKAGLLPAVVFVDSSLTKFSEHPPFNIRAGQRYIAEIIDAIRNGPNWHDSIIFFTYDEHGGYYDHVLPGRATPPDAISPGQCKEKPFPNGSANCSLVFCCPSVTELNRIQSLAHPGEPLATFDQLGVRVPFIAISPFAKQAYVSHQTADLTSITKFIEKRFLNSQSLTQRDSEAYDLADLFDFENKPSENALINLALAPPADIVCS